jgi:molybdopterin-biosynthesis enzyme MoeA-like protein
LTAEAAARAFQAPLVFDAIAFSQIEGFFKARNRVMPECNRKQAMLPKGALRLDNRTGTAPGFAVEFGTCLFFFLPGVPSEMRKMFQEHIKPMLENRYELKPDRLISIKTIGIGESDLQERLSGIDMPPQIKLGFRAAVGEVETKLLCPADYPQVELEKLIKLIQEAIGDPVLGIEGLEASNIDLITIIDKLMQTKAYDLAIVESISRGLLTAKLAHSTSLMSSAYEPSLAKLAHKLKLDYDPGDFEKTVKPIAYKILQDSGVNLVLIQLLKPEDEFNIEIGKVLPVQYILLTGDQFILDVVNISGTPERKQQQATSHALDLLRRFLQGKTLPGRIDKV